MVLKELGDEGQGLRRGRRLARLFALFHPDWSDLSGGGDVKGSSFDQGTDRRQLDRNAFRFMKGPQDSTPVVGSRG